MSGEAAATAQPAPREGSAPAHVILCGLGQVGFRIARLLCALDVPLVVITRETRSEWLDTVRNAGATIRMGDVRDEALVRDAGIDTARALIAATDHDLVNLEVALDARRRRADLPIVARLFDNELAEQLTVSLKLRGAFAISALAAPVIAAAALGERVLAAFTVADEPWVVGNVPVGLLAAHTGLRPLTAPAAGASEVAVFARKPDWDRAQPPAPPRADVQVGSRARGALTFIRKAWQRAPSALRFLAATFFALFLVSGVVFSVGLNLSPLDAFYFLVTTFTTTGYGDINLLNASPALKLYGCLVMLLGGAAVATLFSILTDFIVSARFTDAIGGLRSHRDAHVLVAGLGNVGYRALEALLAASVPAVAVDRDAAGPFVQAARAKNALVLGDARLPETLERLSLDRARAVVAASGDDATNLSVALACRKLAPGIRTVVRIFDSALAEKVKDGLEVDAAFSAARLAAPMFVAAALHEGVKGALVIGDRLVVLAERDGKLDVITEKLSGPERR